VRVVDDHDTFPAEVVESVNEEKRQRVDVGADSRQHRVLDDPVDGVVASHGGRRQHRQVPVASLAGDRSCCVVTARTEEHVHLEPRQGAQLSHG